MERSFFQPSTTSNFLGREVRVGYYDDGTMLSGIEALSSFPGVELRAIATGLSPSERRHFLNGLEVFLLPNGDERMFQEAALMGRAIIALPAARAIIAGVLNHGENGLAVEGSLESVARAIVLLRDNPELRKRYGQEIRQDLLRREAVACAE